MAWKIQSDRSLESHCIFCGIPRVVFHGSFPARSSSRSSKYSLHLVISKYCLAGNARHIFHSARFICYQMFKHEWRTKLFSRIRQSIVKNIRKTWYLRQATLFRRPGIIISLKKSIAGNSLLLKYMSYLHGSKQQFRFLIRFTRNAFVHTRFPLVQFSFNSSF